MSTNMRSLQLLSCSGVTPAGAHAAADAVWAVTRRRVHMEWSRQGRVARVQQQQQPETDLSIGEVE
jgi:hypothetical protein